MKHLFTTLLVAGLCSPAFAQSETKSLALPRSPIVVKVSAQPGWYGSDRVVQVGVEYAVGRRLAFQHELGYGSPGMQDYNYYWSWPAPEILQLRNEVRLYTRNYRRNRTIHVKSDYPLGNYWALELLTRRSERVQPELVNTGDLNGDNEHIHRRLGLLRAVRSVYAGHIKAGRQFPLFQKNNKPARLLLDAHLGIGLRVAVVKEHRKLSTASQYTPNIFLWPNQFDPGIWPAPSFTAGLKLGFAL